MTYQTLDINPSNLAAEIEAETIYIQREYARFGECLFDAEFPYHGDIPFEETAEDEAFFATLYAD